jgi:MFS family permease
MFMRAALMQPSLSQDVGCMFDMGPGLRTDDGTDRAWWVLFGASACMFCGQPAVVLFTFGVFAPEIVASSHWSPLIVATAIVPGTILSALMAPLTGVCADRVGVRAVAMVGGPAYALGFVLLGLLPHSGGGFVGYMVLTCALGFAATPVIYAQLLTGWFSRRRGVALSIMFGCSSLGVAFWSPYSASLIVHFGWRMAYVIVGITAGSIIFLSSVLLLANAPRSVPGAAGRILTGMSLGEAVRTPIFWKIAIVFMLLTGVLGGVSVNLPVILRHQAVSPQTAASIISVVGIAMFLGRVSVGFLLDRWFSPYVTAAISVLPILGFALLLFDHSTVCFFLAAVLLGVGLGSELNAAAYMVSRGFGVRAFGAIYGLITLAYGLCSAAGPGLVGAAIAASFNINAIFALAIALLLPAVFLLRSLRLFDLPYGTRTP